MGLAGHGEDGAVEMPSSSSSNEALSFHPSTGPVLTGEESCSLPSPSEDVPTDMPFGFDYIDWDLSPSVLCSSENEPRDLAQAATLEKKLRKLEFLTRFTSVNGFADSFECGTHSQRQQIALDPEAEADPCPGLPGAVSSHDGASLIRPPPENLDLDLDFDPSLLIGHDDEVHERLGRLSRGLALEASPGTSEMVAKTPSSWTNWPFDPLAIKTHEIVDRLKQATCRKSDHSIISMNWSRLMEEVCVQFFAPRNLRRFLQLFWSLWYPNCPIVHKPTFNAQGSSAVLLAAMVIIGACLSPHESDHETAKLWFNGVEEMAFNDEWIREDPMSGPLRRSETGAARRKRLQLLQSVYLVCLFQNWEGSDEAKRRIRRYR